MDEENEAELQLMVAHEDENGPVRGPIFGSCTCLTKEFKYKHANTIPRWAQQKTLTWFYPDFSAGTRSALITGKRAVET
jgi:hypothetical protein